MVTCDPQVGNGVRFVRMLPEDFEELRQFLAAAEGEGKQQGAEGQP